MTTTTNKTPAQCAGFAVGQKFKQIASGVSCFAVGEVLTFHSDDGTTAPNFKRDSDGRTQYELLSNVAPMGTPAQEAGLVVGETYQMKEGNSEEYPTGSLVKFVNDDGSTCPRFEVSTELDSDGWNYIFVTDVEPVAVATATNVTFEDSTVNVPVEITIITVKRKLTQQERDAIAAIIN